MNFQIRRTFSGALLAAWFVCASFVVAQDKPVRLRNEVIQTPPRSASPFRAAAGGTQPASGLFIVQFTGPLQAAWIEELRTRRAELVQYVPEDAFVARLDRTSLDELRGLPFVRWVGDYRASHKIHASLRRPPGARALLESMSVSVLFSPSATPAELAQARTLMRNGARESRSRFGAVMRGAVTPAQLDQLAQSTAVLWMEPGPKMKLFDEISSKIVGGQSVNSHATFTQQNGFDGRGVTVAVADSGLHLGRTNDMHPDLIGRVKAFIPYGGLLNASDEHSHGTHVTGIIAGSGATGLADENEFIFGLGVASAASIVVQRIFDGEGQYEAPPTFETLTRDAVQAGADIGSNSWGDDTQGRYDVSAMEFDALVRDADEQTDGDQPYILEFSAGNAGPGAQTIGSPAVAKNVIATGASQNDRLDFFVYTEGSEAMADFSSRGPCEDGRIKPDLVAPGTWIASLRSPIGNDDNAWAPISDLYLYQGGTSQAGPQVSGAAAVFVQSYRQSHGGNTPSPAMVKAALINSTADLDDSEGTAPTPNMDEGWGRVDLTQLILSSRLHLFLDQTVLLGTGEIHERSFVVADANEPLRITLAYTDVPGFPAAIPSLVNDLDLELIAPDGRVYRGNQFDRGESVPDAPSADNINNVEGIYIDEPLPGEYIARIRARNVAKDARRDWPGFNQDFALAISANIPPPDVALVLFDRPAYTAPGQIRIKVIDLDRAGQPEIAVTIRSATETNGQTVILLPTGTSGIYTGAVATATGAATSDDLLQISHTNWIRAEYFDASAATVRIASAVADLVPPIIGGVTTTNQFRRTAVIWGTDEPASSVVRFGTNSMLTDSATNRLLTMSHDVELGELVPGQTYYYVVISTDAAGNVSTKDNGGAPFTFVPMPGATVLLVNAYTPDTLFGQINIPLTAYTDALDQTGVTYDVWSVENNGLPGFPDLRPYPIVMWRINDNIYVQEDTIPTVQQNAIQQYLNAGGSFFMASMEILSRVGVNPVPPFRTNVLQIGSFELNPNPFEQCADCDEDVGVPAIEGVETDPFSIGIAATLNYASYPYDEFFGLGPDFSDTFIPGTNAAVFLRESVSGKACGLRYPRTGLDSTGRVVFCSFPFDTIPATGNAPNNRGAFLRRVLQFLAPGLNGVGTAAFSQGRYKLPDLATLEVADSDLAGSMTITALVSSTTAPAPVSITLRETPRPGVFRGSIAVVAHTNAPASGQLRARDGDQILAQYFDQSGGLTIETFAIVDNVPPVIANLTAEPEYQHAFVSWDTSERCDALVQYGESTFLGKTVYRSDLRSSHEILITGLAPDRDYYYRVVSRDAAGNLAVADNGGVLFTFRTRTPLPAPFIDHMEMGTNNWSIFNGEDTQFEWRLGPPNNQVVSAAHSPQNAWASNLNGDQADTIDTFLISPAIDLSGGNVATLKFWHNYDFTERTILDLEEYGRLLIFTNSIMPSFQLAEYGDANGDWTEEEIDLTPYAGQVVILVWYHHLFSFERDYRPGWVLDDIEITVSNIAPGVIQITNNVAQAQFTIVGPNSRSGRGLNARYTNMPPGRYVASFNSVPHHTSPTPQTNMLTSGATLTFAGNYTFPDANTNGMSDAWEMQYFGDIAPDRTSFSDADGDRSTDWAEFIAGTNPTQASSFLRLGPPVPDAGQWLRFDWPAAPGRIYQLQGTMNFGPWTPLSDWLQTNGNSISTFIPGPQPSAPNIFRLEVRP